MSENKEEDRDLKFWQAVHVALDSAKRKLPMFEEPRSIHWNHPDEDWKNDAEVEAIEKDCATDTDALIKHYCQHRIWPKKSKNDARYFVEQRIKWALRLNHIFTIPMSSTGKAAFPRPKQIGWEFVLWLLTEGYEGRNAPAPKAPFSIQREDGTSTEVWT